MLAVLTVLVGKGWLSLATHYYLLSSFCDASTQEKLTCITAVISSLRMPHYTMSYRYALLFVATNEYT